MDWLRGSCILVITLPRYPWSQFCLSGQLKALIYDNLIESADKSVAKLQTSARKARDMPGIFHKDHQSFLSVLLRIELLPVTVIATTSHTY
ncbi:hypothetical protein TNIN_417081 [Trichonephila inaurata madagascariensis]|uniref:Uncharacterized protein n=1 Tax=Trichonephila inaurata madagascariensis TaxID=2747483 RepID=A0A8X6Y0U9_9ARAC|nr:hypothetical protein TNIN_417081 [Trichonephila inaurata madagascariensis]